MIFIRFIDNKQVEAIQRDTSPGEDWKIVPEDFNWTKRYKLVGNSVVEMTTEDIEQEQLDAEKIRVFETLFQEIQQFLQPYVGNSLVEVQKQAAQVQAAKAVLANDAAAIASLTPLSTIRGCSVDEIAEQILEQEAEKQKILILCQAWQDKAELEVDNLETIEELVAYSENFRAQFQAAVGGNND